MPAGESGSLSSLKAADCVYFVLACGAGIWEAWCAGWSGDDALAIFLLISMSAPFAVLSCGYMLQFGGGGARRSSLTLEANRHSLGGNAAVCPTCLPKHDRGNTSLDCGRFSG